MAKLDDERVLADKKKSELELNIEAIMASQASIIKTIGELVKRVETTHADFVKYAKAGRFGS